MPKSVLITVILLVAILVPNSGILAAQSSISEISDRYFLIIPPYWRTENSTAREKKATKVMLSKMKADPSLVFHVTGHTDTLGSEDENMAIGFYYAQNIARELKTSLGLSGDSVIVKSMGETEPRVAAGDYKQQAANRRVVVRIGKRETKRKSPVTTAEKDMSGHVLILEPSAGKVDRAYQRVRAIVEGKSKSAMLVVNGISSLISVQNNRVEGEAVLKKGENFIEIMAWDEEGSYGKDSVSVTYKPPPPSVRLQTPRNGEVFNTTESPVIEVRGRVKSATGLQEAFLFLNSSPRRIEIERDGTFSQEIVLIRESNKIRVEVVDTGEKTATSPEINVRTINMSPKDLVVFLTWDSPGVDLDLHVWGPGNKHTYHGALDPFENSQAVVHGALDIDDKDGFGPEVFSLAGGEPGIYVIEAWYHYSPTSGACQAQVTVVLNPAEPARRMTRVFGPRTMQPGTLARWEVTRIKMPDGKFIDE